VLIAPVPVLCQQLALRGDKRIGWQWTDFVQEKFRTANLAASGTDDGCLAQQQSLAKAAGRASEAVLAVQVSTQVSASTAIAVSVQAAAAPAGPAVPAPVRANADLFPVADGWEQSRRPYRREISLR